MNSKELFLLNKDRADQLRAIVHQHWFRECLMAVRAELMSNSSVSGDQLKGALLYETTLLDLSESLPDAPEQVTVLNHDLDNPRKPDPKKPSTPKT